MMHQTFSQEPFLVSGLHGDQIMGARSNHLGLPFLHQCSQRFPFLVR